MNKLSLMILASTALVVLAACSKDEIPATAQAAEASPQPAAPSQPPALTGKSGSVVETMNASGYTYVLVDTGKEQIWAAAPQFSVAVGDQVVVPEGMAMKNYHSQTLNRDFDVVYFVESVLNASNPTMPAAGGTPQMPEGHPPITGMTATPDIDFSGISKPENGHTIGEIYASKDSLSGQSVVVRGKVVKFSPQIMGTNWIHLQDGTGQAASGTHDLTVTSNTQVKVGDTIIAEGAVTVDKDFGYGYKYDLIMENASVSVEQ